jgi:hypothetical protein
MPAWQTQSPEFNPQFQQNKSTEYATPNEIIDSGNNVQLMLRH